MLRCGWVQPWKYNKMPDSSTILHSELNLLGKYKKPKFLTSTEKLRLGNCYIFSIRTLQQKNGRPWCVSH